MYFPHQFLQSFIHAISIGLAIKMEIKYLFHNNIEPASGKYQIGFDWLQIAGLTLPSTVRRKRWPQKLHPARLQTWMYLLGD